VRGYAELKRMKILACKNMGGSDNYFAKGNSDDEVINKMLNHMREAHPEKLENISEERMRTLKNTMKANITENKVV
jgi:predicted small metal-binding protein